MSEAERDSFLAEQRTCRMATVGSDGQPHTSALWFVWDGSAVWINSLTRSQRYFDLQGEPRISLVVDGGDVFGELRGVCIEGTTETVGEAPRTGEPVPELDEPERAFARKYMGIDDFPKDGRHAWVKVTPSKITSWDFRKFGS